MEYIKLMLLVCNVGLTFEIINYDEINDINDEIANLNGGTTNIKLDAENDWIRFEFLNNVYPTHYKVQLTVDTKLSYPNISLSGQVDINITIVPILRDFPHHSNNMIKLLFLHAKNIDLDNFDTTLSNSKGIFFVQESFTVLENFIGIRFIELVPPDNYTLKIVFRSTVNDSFIRNKLPPEHTMFGLKNDLIMTHFGDDATRQLFPCWDDPAYKTTFDIRVTHEEEYTVLSNMPVLKIDNADAFTNIDEPDMKCTKFMTTPMMSTHQLVILFKPFDLFADPTETVYTWRKSDKTSIISFIHNTANDISKYLQEYTKYITPLETVQKIDHVIVPNAPYSKGQLGLIIYRESDVIYDETKDPIDVKINAKNMIEYHVAHQWFGGLVTPKFWNDSWLTESFALYFSYYFPKKKIGSQLDDDELWKNDMEDKVVQYRIINSFNDVLEIDNGSMPPVLYEPESVFLPSLRKHYYHDSTAAINHKGALILRMFNNTFSEEKFQKYIINYLNKYKYGLVTYNDFLSILEDWIGKWNGNSLEVAVENIVKNWIIQKGYPIVSVKIDRENSMVTFFQTSSIYKPSDVNPEDDDIKNPEWLIPVTYMMLKRMNDKLYPSYGFLWVFPLDDVNKYGFSNSYFINKDNWILINVGLTGYYHVRYDHQSWENFGNLLNSQEYSIIPAINRAQLIIDICVEYKNHRTDWHLFSLITRYLIHYETDYTIPWAAMLKCLDMLAEFFKLQEGIPFKLFIGEYYFGFILDEIRYEENPYDDDLRKLMRQKLASYACEYGHSKCRSVAADKLNKYFADPTIHKILPWWQDWTFCFGLTQRDIDDTIWDQIVEYYINTKNKTILYYLTCAENSEILTTLLYKTADEKNKLYMEKTDQIDIFNTIIRKHINDDVFFSKIQDNINLIPKSISFIDAFDTMISNIYSNVKLDLLYKSIINVTDNSNECEAIKNKIAQQRKKIAALSYKIDMMFPNINILYTIYKYTDN